MPYSRRRRRTLGDAEPIQSGITYHVTGYGYPDPANVQVLGDGSTLIDLGNYFRTAGLTTPQGTGSSSSSSSITGITDWLKRNQNTVLIASAALLAVSVLKGRGKR